jgi:hypothetical protein
MPYVDEIYNFYYTADNSTSGLSDVLAYILDPENNLTGPFTMIETALAGTYVYEYTPTVSGQYIFTADSTLVPKKLILTVNFDEVASYIPVAQFDNG